MIFHTRSEPYARIRVSALFFSILCVITVPILVRAASAPTPSQNPSLQCFTRAECTNYYSVHAQGASDDAKRYKQYMARSDYLARVWQENTKMCGPASGFCYSAPPIVKLSVPLPFLVGDSVQGLDQYISSLYMAGVYLASVLAIFLIIIGGYLWLFAGGDSTRIAKAKRRISAAVTGLVFLIFSYAILNAINPDLVSLSFKGVPLVRTEGLGGSACKPQPGQTLVQVKSEPGNTQNTYVAADGAIKTAGAHTLKSALCGQRFEMVTQADKEAYGGYCSGFWCPFSFSCELASGQCTAMVATGIMTQNWKNPANFVQTVGLYRFSRLGSGQTFMEKVGETQMNPGESSFAITVAGPANSILHNSVYDGLTQQKYVSDFAYKSDGSVDPALYFPATSYYYFAINVQGARGRGIGVGQGIYMVNNNCEIIKKGIGKAFTPTSIEYNDLLYGVGGAGSGNPTGFVIANFTSWPIAQLECTMDESSFFY